MLEGTFNFPAVWRISASRSSKEEMGIENPTDSFSATWNVTFNVGDMEDDVDPLVPVAVGGSSIPALEFSFVVFNVSFNVVTFMDVMPCAMICNRDYTSTTINQLLEQNRTPFD